MRMVIENQYLPQFQGNMSSFTCKVTLGTFKSQKLVSGLRKSSISLKLLNNNGYFYIDRYAEPVYIMRAGMPHRAG